MVTKPTFSERLFPALKAGQEHLMYMTPGLGEYLSAKDSIKAAKLAQSLGGWDKAKMYGLSTLAGLGSLPIAGTIMGATGASPALKQIIKSSIKSSTKAPSKIISPDEAKILDDFFEGPKEISDTKSTLIKLGKDPNKRMTFDEKHLAYLGNKFGLNKSAKELAKGPANKRGGWREFMNLDTGLPMIKKGSIPREALHPAYRKSVRRYHRHPLSAAGKSSREQFKINKAIDDFTALKDKMESGALTLAEAIDPKNKLPRATRHYQRVGRFEKYADDIKDVDKELHDFLTREIDNYKLGEVTTKKSRFGNKKLEKWREELSEKLGIPIKDLQRAHSTMQQRYIKINKLRKEGKITLAEYQDLRKPHYLLLNPDNQAHRTLENNLDALLDRRFEQSQSKQLDKLSTTDKGIDKLINKMEGMKVESTLWDPSANKLKTFGAQPGEEGLKYRFIKRKPRKTTEEVLYIKKMKERMKEEGLKLNTGGIVGISQLTRTL